MLGAEFQLSAMGSWIFKSLVARVVARVLRRSVCFWHSHRACAGVSVSWVQRGHMFVGNVAGLWLCRRVFVGRELLLVCMMSLCCAGSLDRVGPCLSMLCAPFSLAINLSVKSTSVDGL